MFQLICDPSGVVVETTLKELVPAIIKWGNKLDHVLRVLLSHILSSAQVLVFLCAFGCDLELHPWQLFLSRISSLKIAALSTSFCSWRVYRVTSTCIGGKGALEHRCSIENAGGVAFFGAPESNWNMPLLVHHRNYTIFVIYHVAWIVCKVSLAWNVHLVSISIGLVKELIELTVGSWMSHPFTHECLVGRWWKEGEVNGRIGGGSGLVSRSH